MSAVLLQNGLVYSGGRLERLDVLVVGDSIAQVGPALAAEGAAAVDCEGCVIAPGLIDLHTHLREPGFSHKETIRTGTMAALAGGFTTVCAMPNLSPVPDTAEHLEAELSLIRQGALCEVLPYGAITCGQAGQALSDIEVLAPHCVGFSDDGKGIQSHKLMREAMLEIARADRLLAAHCEDERFPAADSQSEWRQIERDIDLAAQTGVRYHVCHVSARESVQLIREAKAGGLSVTCECTPHQLALSREDITDESRFRMNPPIRGREDREAIVEGLLDGTIDCIATDHAPHTEEEKARGANGVVGLETAFGVCHTLLCESGLLALPALLARLVDRPAEILRRRAPRVFPGEPASLCVLDPGARWCVCPDQFKSMGKSSPFAGRTLTGRVRTTLFLGNIVWQMESVGGNA